VIPVFAELSRFKSVIGITYPKIKFFLEVGLRQKNPASYPPQGDGWLGSVHEEQAVGKWFLVMPPEVEGLYEEENILRRPGHDKMEKPIDVNRPESPLAGKAGNPTGTD